jgi:hypothetical protein
MREEFNPLIKSCTTWTIPAAETRSIGWPADAQTPMVFATQLRQLNLDKTTPAHLDGKAKTIYAATQWQRTKPPGRQTV